MKYLVNGAAHQPSQERGVLIGEDVFTTCFSCLQTAKKVSLMRV